MVKKSKCWQTFEIKVFKQGSISFVRDFHSRKIIFQKARAFLFIYKSAGKANIFHLFPPKSHIYALKSQNFEKVDKIYAKI